jgi:hypothetical protein
MNSLRGGEETKGGAPRECGVEIGKEETADEKKERKGERASLFQKKVEASRTLEDFPRIFS